MNTNKTILICPLNWGLGHATRDIPIIRRLQSMGYKVIVATESPLTELLNEAVPGLTFEYFPGPKVTYSKTKLLTIKLLGQIPNWIRWLKKERKTIDRLVQKHQPHLIVSDNRYGAHHPKVRSILITHQLMVKLPKGLQWAESLAHQLIGSLVSRFDACWVPDFEKAASLAGDLVHRYPLPANARLIGPISRFMDIPLPGSSVHPQYECVAILSGPEPQKSLLKTRLIEHLARHSLKSLIVTGEPNRELEKNFYKEKTITLIPHLNQEKLAQLICHTPIIVARSGYSTIMDLYFLNRKALLVPTPGQTEQNYLAAFNAQKHHCVAQNKIPSIPLTECSSRAHPITPHIPENHLLQPALDSIEELLTNN